MRSNSIGSSLNITFLEDEGRMSTMICTSLIILCENVLVSNLFVQITRYVLCCMNYVKDGNDCECIVQG